jgi:hypothetical protein
MALNEQAATVPTDKPTLRLEVKELVVVLPAMASALALTYDVGFFSGIDIRFFTLFSLSEHIVFALQAIPFALVMVTWFAATVRHAESAKAFRGAKLSGYITGISLVACFFVLMPGIYSFVLLPVFVVILNRYVERRRESQLFGLVLVLFFFVLLLGQDLSRLSTSARAYTYTVTTDKGIFEGKLIRSGERGLLFYEPVADQYRILRWEGVQSVTSTYHAIPFKQRMFGVLVDRWNYLLGRKNP